MSKKVFVFGPESRLRTSNEDTVRGPLSAHHGTTDAVMLGQYVFDLRDGEAVEYERGGEHYYARVLSKDYVVDLERVDEEMAICKRRLAALEKDRQRLLELALVDARVVREDDIP